MKIKRGNSEPISINTGSNPPSWIFNHSSTHDKVSTHTFRASIPAMHFKTLTSSVALLLFSSAINCSPLLEERTDGTGCNADNCLRALRRFSVEAIPFCSAYISVPVITTVIATTTPVT